jgi:hypothetical protein
MTVYCATPATLRLEAVNTAGTVTSTLDLMDQANGYRVQSLDVGFPTVRAVTAAQPSRDGDLDTTALYGPRTVTVTGSFVPSSQGSRQKAMQALAWWCQPRLRPRLVYAYDSDEAPLYLWVRGAALAAPASNPAVSAFTVSWVAPDPVARTLTTQNITINPSATGTATNNGTYRAWPILDIYGPATNPVVTWNPPAPPSQIAFSSLTIASGAYVEVDTGAQTCLLGGDPNQSVYSGLNFASTVWAGLEPGATTLQFNATSTAAPARLVVTWADAAI